ncbi:MAG: bestrophin family ion channel [Nannocystaceae bacterium]
MIVGTSGSVWGLLRWQWKKALFFIFTATLVTVLHKFVDIAHVLLPTTPVLVVGGALAIFVSFRTNSAYDRWWEGRRLWGQLVNSSRALASQALCYLRDAALARTIVHRQAAYVHILRCLLREQEPWADEHVARLLDAPAREALRGESSPTHAILHGFLASLTEVSDRGELDPLRLQSFDRTIATLLDVQGGCERIKKTPMPRSYGFIADRLIVAYGALFPLAMTEELGWLMIPVNVLVCISFALISEVGRVLEDPFTMFWNSLPLTTLSLTIENNIRQRLGDRDIPPVPKPEPPGILM